MFQSFISDLQKGVISSSVNFDDYVKSKVGEMPQGLEMPNMGDQVGMMLGRGPEDGMRMGDRPAWLDDFDDFDDYDDDRR